MPQPKSPARSARTQPAAKKTTAGATAARASKTPAAKPAASRTAAAKPAASRGAAKSTGSRTAAKPAASRGAAAKSTGSRTAAKPAASRGAAARGSATKTATKAPARPARAKAAGAKPTSAAKAPARKPTPAKAGGAPEDTIAANVAAVREFLTRGVLLTAERLQETLDDAVARGRLTSTDADELVARLISIGRGQAEEIRSELETVRGEIEQLLEQSPADVLSAGLRAGSQLTPDRVVRELDRVRRVIGIGPAFPILAYDELSAPQVIERLEDLNSAQLRKVRDRERRTAKRKTVLDAIERALS